MLELHSLAPMAYYPTWQVRQDCMVSHVLLHFRYTVRPSSDHAEVRCSFKFSNMDRLTQT